MSLIGFAGQRRPGRLQKIRRLMSLVFVRLFRTFHKACQILGLGASGSLFSDFQKGNNKNQK